MTVPPEPWPPTHVWPAPGHGGLRRGGVDAAEHRTLVGAAIAENRLTEIIDFIDINQAFFRLLSLLPNQNTLNRGYYN